MNGRIPFITLLLLGVLFASVYSFGYRLVNRTVVYPAYEDYVPLVSHVDDSQAATAETAAGEIAYQRALEEYSTDSLRHDQWAYVIEMIVMVLLVAVAFFGLRRWSVLAGGLLLGLTLGYLSIHSAFFALDPTLSVDLTQPGTLMAVTIRFLAVLLALIVVAVFALQTVEERAE